MLIERDSYLSQLVRKQWNGRVKIVTGIRRCGQSVLLMELFKGYLVASGVSEDSVALG